MKRLVEIDPATMTTREFDHVKIQRSALALKAYLLQLDPSKDQCGIRSQVLPIVEEALLQTLKLPLEVRRKPLRREATEGLLPDEYSRLAAPFFVAITGMSGLGDDLLKPVHKDGKQFVWMEFEEPLLPHVQRTK